MSRRRGVAAAIGGFALGLVTVVGAAAPESGVTIQLFQFRPGKLDVKAGTRVMWTNQDEIEHTVTAGTPEKRDGRFDLRLNGKGTTAGVEFTQPGVYTYFCDRHQHMRGEIRVN